MYARSRVLSYVLPVVCCAIVLLLIHLMPVLLDRGVLVVFLAAVSICAWYGGWVPALLVTLFAGGYMAWFVLPPHDSLQIASKADMLRLGVFLLVAILVSSQHSQRKRVEHALQQSEQRLALALEAANMGAWEWDLRSKRFFWSPGLERIFGRLPGDFSRSYEEFFAYIHPDDQDFLKRAVLHSAESGQEFEIEHRIVRPDGEIRAVLTRGRIFRNSGGTAERVLAVGMDVTHRPATSARSAISPAPVTHLA